MCLHAGGDLQRRGQDDEEHREYHARRVPSAARRGQRTGCVPALRARFAQQAARLPRRRGLSRRAGGGGSPLRGLRPPCPASPSFRSEGTREQRRARRAGAASRSLNYLAPAPSLFWHAGLSQLNFSEYSYQLFPFLPKNDFLSTKCPFCPSQAGRPVFTSPRPDPARSCPGAGALGGCQAPQPAWLGPAPLRGASGDCRARATPGQLGVNVAGSQASWLVVGVSPAWQALGGSPIRTGAFLAKPVRQRGPGGRPAAAVCARRCRRPDGQGTVPRVPLRAGTGSCGSVPAGEDPNPGVSNRPACVLGQQGQRESLGSSATWLGLGKLLLQSGARAGPRA